MRTRIFRLLTYTVAVLCLSTSSFGQVRASITIGPPSLPTYEQPLYPGDGYIWTPGYWAWDGDYYWVPGTWVLPPQIGFLWTPGYWGMGRSWLRLPQRLLGLVGGFLRRHPLRLRLLRSRLRRRALGQGALLLQHAWNHVDAKIVHRVYNSRGNEGTGDHVSFNGGNGGITARATAQEEAVARGRHLPPAAAQVQHAWTAHNAPQQRYATNRGLPQVVATARPRTAVHPKDLPPIEHAAPPHTGNPQQDQKYLQQQERLVAQQNRDRQTLQQKQDQELQQRARQSDEHRAQQIEQQHQRQTQQLQQRHTQQTQHMEQKQQPRAKGGAHGDKGR